MRCWANECVPTLAGAAPRPDPTGDESGRRRDTGVGHVRETNVGNTADPGKCSVSNRTPGPLDPWWALSWTLELEDPAHPRKTGKSGSLGIYPLASATTNHAR